MNLPLVPRFTDKKIDLWSIAMQTILRYNGLEYWIKKGFDDPYDNAKDALMLYLIQQALDDNILHVVVATNMTKEACESLKMQFESDIIRQHAESQFVEKYAEHESAVAA